LPRIALKLEYAGDRFHGSQFQGRVRTVQEELELAVGTFLRMPERKAKVSFSGRTDTGVHSRGQVAHFDSAADVDLWRFCWGVNGILKQDLSITAAQVVPDRFHARFTATERTYAYRILNRTQRSALLKDTYWFVPAQLDIESMQEAASMLVGTHDFTAFRSTSSEETSPICRVKSAQILNLGEGRLEFWISANHFVYNMVRIIVGTLIEIGLGKRPIEDVGLALSERQRRTTGPTAPALGLCLEAVEYPEELELFKNASFQGRELIENLEISSRD